ncbi:septation protein A [Azohydromonas aeria]|uniref:septation protein A n=1 Tax=Azohydromonas aeria TaxID=2590212 RepID=UPI0012FC5606|nr:septation protein A [Azohydromonas aeria]
MKLLLDFLPILLFFGTFKYAGAHAQQSADFATEHFGFLVSGGVVGAAEAPVLLATIVVIIATLAQVAWIVARGRKVDTMLWVSLALVVVLGGATIWFHSETFIKWKPSVLYWVMGTSLWLSHVLLRKNLLRLLLGEQLQLPDAVWQRLNGMWVAFFGVMGLLNIWVAYTFSTDAWVNFKLFGGIGLMLLFTLAQGLYLSRYLPDESAAASKDKARPGAQ